MRALRISLIVFGVLLVLALIADRIALSMAQGEVASQARSSLSLDSEPDVSIKGFPFLTQVLGNHLDRVDLGLDGYEALVDEQTLTLEELDVRLDDVELGDGYSSAVAARAGGEGLISYEELTRAYGELLAVSGTGFGVEFGHAGEGRLLLTLQASVLGQSLDVGEVAGDVVLENGSIRLEVADEDIPDTGGPEVQAAIREQLDIVRPITGLPDGLSLDSLEPTEDGLALTITGRDVDITG
ncbi:LmeA family phospholipid-binding protein [Streptomyces sp. URMC 129]|uniref:LmeA family phospholipid-binding protein n=1 Tax=Streptomyces sp. URMC 129 TaxID=3423407 RepID=UPI003F1B6538